MASIIRFHYNGDPDGKIREVADWKESSKYLEGKDIADGVYKTFRKDRVLAYLDGAEGQLRDPNPEPPVFKPSAPPDQRPHIIFTGFLKQQRAALEVRAEAAGMRVCTKVTQRCLFLVKGDNAGPAKVAAARQLSAYILNEAQFDALLETGVVADDVV